MTSVFATEELMDKFNLMKQYVQRAVGKPLEALRPEPLSGWDAVEALWPLNDLFRPYLHQIRSLGYDKSFEAEADAAIEALTTAGASGWSDLSAGAWRVLLERHQQGIAVALANEQAGNPLMPIPSGLMSEQRTIVVALFLLHGMKLPWPAADRTGLELPAGSAQASLRLH